MAEYRNKVTGSLVSVADDLVLGTDFERIDVVEKPVGKPVSVKKTEKAVDSAVAGDSK